MIDFPNSPANGDVFTSGNSSWAWNAATSQWRTSLIALNPKVQRFSGNGSTTQFTLNSVPPSVNFLDVYITGAYQQKDTYTVANNIITFSEAPPIGTENIEVEWGSTLDIGMPSDNSVSTIKLQDASVTTAKLGLASVTPSRLSAGAPTWDANGLLTLAQGQIKFPATQSASSDANTLDDYEEGTWSPQFQTSGGGLSVTYNVQNGIYVKVGRMVTVWGNILLSGKTASGSGYLQIAALPFQIDSTGPSEFGGAVGMSYLWASNPCICIQPSAGTTTAILNYNFTNGNSTGSDLGSNSYFRFCITYRAQS